MGGLGAAGEGEAGEGGASFQVPRGPWGCEVVEVGVGTVEEGERP